MAETVCLRPPTPRFCSAFDTQDTSATTHVDPLYPTASLTLQAHSTVESAAWPAGTLASVRSASTRHARCSFPNYGSTLEPPGHASAFGMNKFAASSALASTTLAHTNAARLKPVRPVCQDCILRRLRCKTTPAIPATDADHDAISSLRIAAAHHAQPPLIPPVAATAPTTCPA